MLTSLHVDASLQAPGSTSSAFSSGNWIHLFCLLYRKLDPPLPRLLFRKLIHLFRAYSSGTPDSMYAYSFRHTDSMPTLLFRNTDSMPTLLFRHTSLRYSSHRSTLRYSSGTQIPRLRYSSGSRILRLRYSSGLTDRNPYLDL
ncbi:hypothetical protein TNCT_735201 [Trichonephila clavata]|uniref:Uncharacterized protein n=1 Tax=Trichonephila clavata TaxID=2740835 RepID=A0A8X6GGE2_TRICU|nr:hypothetical protein TNCT_735201 [Trichonephila clavata]